MLNNDYYFYLDCRRLKVETDLSVEGQHKGVSMTTSCTAGSTSDDEQHKQVIRENQFAQVMFCNVSLGGFKE